MKCIRKIIVNLLLLSLLISMPSLANMNNNWYIDEYGNHVYNHETWSVNERGEYVYITDYFYNYELQPGYAMVNYDPKSNVFVIYFKGSKNTGKLSASAVYNLMYIGDDDSSNSRCFIKSAVTGTDNNGDLMIAFLDTDDGHFINTVMSHNETVLSLSEKGKSAAAFVLKQLK